MSSHDSRFVADAIILYRICFKLIWITIRKVMPDAPIQRLVHFPDEQPDPLVSIARSWSLASKANQTQLAANVLEAEFWGLDGGLPSCPLP